MSALDTLLYGYRTLLAATVAVSQRSKLNFSSAFTVADNAATESTDVGLSGTVTATLATVTTMVLSVLRLTSEDNALTGSQNNVTIGNNTIVRVTAAGAVTWTGIAADSGRRVLLVHSVGAGGMTLVHASASSTASNRFALPNSANITLVTNQIAILVYDTTQARWLYVGSVGGGGFTPPTGTGLVTVTGGVLNGAATAVTGTGSGVLDTSPTFRTSVLLNNPANTFAYSFVGAAIAAARQITLPLLTAGDTMVTEAFAQILTNKQYRLGRVTNSTAGGTLNDLALAATTSVIVFNGVGALTITGFANGADGRELTIINATTSTITIPDSSASSAAANRIRSAYAASTVIQDGVAVKFVYDSVTTNWHTQVSF